MKHVADFSDYQIGINFNTLGVHYDGVIVKVSEGCTLMEYQEDFIEAAKERGMAWGVYCLTRARSVERAILEADTLVDELNRIRNNIIDLWGPTLGIWFDIEPDQAAKVGDPDLLTAMASAFICRCMDRGYKNLGSLQPGVYGTYDTLTNNFKPYDLEKWVPYWVAEPGNWKCDFKAENPDLKVVLWQKEFNKPFAGKEVDDNEYYEG